MRVGQRGLRNERAGAEEVPRSGDVVAGFIPEIRQAEQGDVREIDRREEDGVEHAERKLGLSAAVAVTECGYHARFGCVLVNGAGLRRQLLVESDGAEG